MCAKGESARLGSAWSALKDRAVCAPTLVHIHMRRRKLRPDLLFQASTFAHHSTKRPSPARPHVFARAAFSIPHREIVSAIPVCCGGWECRRSSRASRQIATGQGAACTANTARVPQARPTLAPLSNIARFDVPRCRACSLVHRIRHQLVSMDLEHINPILISFSSLAELLVLFVPPHPLLPSIPAPSAALNRHQRSTSGGASLHQ